MKYSWLDDHIQNLCSELSQEASQLGYNCFKDYTKIGHDLQFV